MATAVQEYIRVAADKEAADKEAVRQRLLKEVQLGLLLAEHGINYVPEEIKPFQVSTRPLGGNREGELTGFSLPGGVTARGSLSRYTPYKLVVEDSRPVLYNDGVVVGEIAFPKAHPITEAKLSTGETFSQISYVSLEGGISVAYSTECSLKDAGEDCQFCSINHRNKDNTQNQVNLKSPRQIAEAYYLARQVGEGNHFRISGGFVPERREVEYYLDVVDAIRERYSDFYGVAIIGAPADLSILHKYKEAGYTDISHNLEVWDRNLFAAICPGKEKRNGGWKHWVESLEYSVEVFGKGNVHTNFVAGLAPKESTLEGIEYLASKGVVPHFSVFRPEKDTPLYGYRSPETFWHWDVLDKATDIFRRYGFNTLQLYSGPASAPYHGQAYQIKFGEFEGDRLQQWRFPLLQQQAASNQ